MSSGIPLLRSMVPSPKPELKQPGSSLPRPTTQIPHPAKSSHSSSSRDLLRDTAMRNQLLLQKSSLPLSHIPSRVPAATLRGRATRSAFSSPHVPRKEAPRSKDTLDAPSSGSFLEDPQKLRRNGNKNQPNSTSRPPHRRLDNIDTHDTVEEGKGGPLGHAKAVELPMPKSNNANLLHSLLSDGSSVPQRPKCGLEQDRRGSLSDEEMATPEALSPATPGPPPSDDIAVAPPKGKMAPAVNMAAVAPFRYRLQIQEENDVSSMEDFSDCSSDSMEVCCEDLPAGE
ncbi:neuron navigator 1-like isoform X2 [Arapaima gigas]